MRSLRRTGLSDGFATGSKHHGKAHQVRSSRRYDCPLVGESVPRLSTQRRGNFYFQGDTVFSYGSHFPIARHVETRRGSAVLFTTRDYSVTTSGHKWTVLGACKHLTVFHVQHPTDSDRKQQFDEYRQRDVELARKYSRARSNRPWILGSLRNLVDEANRFAQFFGLRSRLSMPADLSAMEAECKAIEKRERERRQRAEAKRDGKRWSACNTGWTGKPIFSVSNRMARSGCGSRATNCRLRGRRVPLEHAIKAFRLIKRLHDTGQAYERNGYSVHLGAFVLDAVDAQGNVTAGCHNVAWEEIERVAILAGVN